MQRKSVVCRLCQNHYMSTPDDSPRIHAPEIDEAPSEEETAEVEKERDRLKEFVRGLTPAQIKDGEWFAKLLTFSVTSYTKKVDWAYFQEKYPGVPRDAVVDQRIKLAARYASVEGGLSASAYTGVIVATLGTAGGASPVTVPAAVATLMVDVAYITQLQLRLAYDIAVLYGITINMDDPDDLWKLIRVAFTIKGGEAIREGVVKAVPALVRPLLKRLYSGAVLSAAKSLPVVGKFLLQRTVIKVGIPLVGIPLAVVINRWTTVVAGKHARAVFRNEARILEAAERLLERSTHPELLLWVAWLVVQSDGKTSDDEALLLKHVIRLAKEHHQIEDERLARVIDIDPADVWAKINAADDDLSDIVAAAEVVAAIDGDVNPREQKVLDAIRERCRSK